ALLTASGPVSLSSSSASSCSGIRTATVPLVSPRSQIRLRLARITRVRPPGQNSSMRSLPNAFRSSTSAVAARTVPTSTGGGIWRSRPLAASRLVTAGGENASAASPYTVSVGITARSPLRSEAVASARPVTRSAASVQSYRALMPAHLSTCCQWSPCHAVSLGTGEPGGDETVPPGQVFVVAGVPPALLLRECPVDRRALRRAVLHRHQPAGPQQPPRALLDDPDGVQPVLAAPQRAGRVVLGDFGRDGGADRYIRRVADHQIHGTAQRRQGAGEVSRVEADPAPGVRGTVRPARDVALRPLPGQRVGLHRVYPCARHLLSDRQRDRRAAGAQIRHHRLGYV